MAFREPILSEAALIKQACLDLTAGKADGILKLLDRIGEFRTFIHLQSYLEKQLPKESRGKEIETKRELFIANIRKLYQTEPRLRGVFGELIRSPDVTLIPHVYSLAEAREKLLDPKKNQGILMLGTKWCHNCPAQYPQLKKSHILDGIPVYYFNPEVKGEETDTFRLIKQYKSDQDQLNYPTFLNRVNQKIIVTEGYILDVFIKD